MSAARLPLVHLIVHRCSSVAALPLLRLLVHHWLSLSCTCSGSPVRRSSICSCIARASARALLVRLFVIALPLVCLLESWSLVRGSCIARPSTGVVAALSLGSTWHCVRFCSTVRLFGCSVLFDCSVLHSARLDFVLFGCSTLLALCAFLFYLLVEFGRHAVHTLCPTRDVPSMGYHSFAVPCSGVLRAS